MDAAKKSVDCLMCCDKVETGPQNLDYLFRCRRCGQYGVSRELAMAPLIPPELKGFISAATRQASELGRPLLLKSGELRAIAAPHQNARVSDKVEKTLRFVAAQCVLPGKVAPVDPSFDYPVADCADEREFEAYLAHLLKRGLLEENHAYQADMNAYAPTIEGWQYLEPRAPIGGIPGRCFVAMSFDPSLDEAYNRGIAPAIKNCGFDVVCMRDIPTNEGITDRILAEIRLAQFVVADFTGQRGGVYFEAGFARGLGREVIWCCRKDELALVHFDIRHLGHVVWETAEDLKERLAASIRANIIPTR